MGWNITCMFVIVVVVVVVVVENPFIKRYQHEKIFASGQQEYNRGLQCKRFCLISDRCMGFDCK